MRQRQQHPTGMEEERAGRKLPCHTGELHAPRRRRQVLHLTLSQPRMNGRDHEGLAWMRSSFLYVYLDGELVQSLKLPIKFKDVKTWNWTMTFAMDLGWRRLSVGIEAVRKDSCVNKFGRVVVFRTDEPHTSGLTAVIGAAKVLLLDALVIGDDEDNDDSDVEENKKKKKRRLDEERKLVEGTQVFDERVELQSWRWEVGREPTNVVCGTVGVHMYIAHE